MEIKQHPLSSAFPSMSESDQATLTADIDKNGQLDAITLFAGMVLDGWHRYQACLALGRDPLTCLLAADIDPVVFVMSHNMHRRHLNESQRSIAVVACRSWAPVGKPNQSETGHVSSLAEMAKEADVSTKTIQRAKTAYDGGLGDKVKNKELTVNKAAELVKPPKPADKPIEPETEPAPQSEMVTIEKERYDTMIESMEQNLAEGLALEKVLDGNFMLEDAVKTIKQQVEQIRLINLSLGGAHNKNNELLKIIKSRDRQISRLEKEIDQLKIEALPL